jgi:type I restriction enzyme, S subunit
MAIPQPPPDEQAGIACILDAVDTALECTRMAIERARNLRQSLIHELLSKGVRSERQRKTAAGLVPATWICDPLGQHISDGPTNGVYRPESDYAEHGTKIVRIDDFEDGRVNDISRLRRVVVEPAVQRRYALNKDDVLVNRVNSLSHIGKVALIASVNEPMIFESNMMRLRCGQRLRPDFLVTVLCSDIARRHWLARAKPAVNQASINQRDVRELPVPVPKDDNEQREIVQIVGAAQQKVDRLESVRTAQTLLKKSLMHDLLTGQVRVRSLIEATLP